MNMRRKWLFYGIALAYEWNGIHYVITFTRYERKEVCTVTRLTGINCNQIKFERLAYKMLKLHFNRCKFYHGSIALDKVFYINNVRFTSNYSREF